MEVDLQTKTILGDCLDVMKTLETNSVDSIVSDPPYGISFMGKKWDYDVPSVELWKEVFRVLKPVHFYYHSQELELIIEWQLILKMLVLRLGI